MAILPNPILVLDPSDNDRVCEYLQSYANDWESALNFLYEWSKASGYVIDYDAIVNRMRAYYGD